MKGSIQGSAEHVHFSSIINIGSSGIFAPFLVLFTKFSVPLWSVMYILDCFILRFWGDELFSEGIPKVVPCSIGNRICCKCISNAIASPISGLGSLFEIG